MLEYTHNKALFFHKLSSDHQNDNFEAFSRLSIVLIAEKTNTNSCQAWILVNFTNVAPAHSSIQYCQIFWYHVIEETYSYPHVWKFPENILKSVNFFLRRTVDQIWVSIMKFDKSKFKCVQTQHVISGKKKRFILPFLSKISGPLKKKSSINFKEPIKHDQT